MESHPLHTFGQWGDMDDSEILWEKISYAGFLEQRPNILPPYPLDHPRTRRLQAWVDAFHEQILAMNPKMMAPRPQVMLVKDPTVNAYVSGINVCLDVGVVFVGNEQGKALDEGRLRIANAGKYADVSTSPQPCLSKSVDETFLRSVLELQMGDNAKCASRLISTTHGKKEFRLDLGCVDENLRQALGGVKSVGAIQYNAIGNTFVVNDGFFSFKEEEVVSVLAHELGHYYRAHGLTTTRKYNFFYELDRYHNLGIRPVPLSEENYLATLGKEVADQIPKYLTYYGVQNQKLHSIVFQAVRTVPYYFAHLCGEESCAADCAKLTSYFTDADQNKLSELIGAFPAHGPLPDKSESQRFYQEFEVKAFACFDKVSLKPESHVAIHAFLKQWPLRDLDSVVPLDRLKTATELFATISELAPGLTKQQNEVVIETFAKADKNKLGFYTTEQEADELSLELISRLGISAHFAIEAFIRTLGESEKVSQNSFRFPGELDYATCKRDYDGGFVDFVPISDYADNHHSSCFRAYNVFREATVHRAEIEQLPKVVGISPDQQLWDSL